MFGDFNLPAINWSNLAASTVRHNIEADFVNTYLTFGLTQLVTNPTRQTDHTSSILDLVLSSNPDSVSSISYHPGLSDHSIIHVSVEGNVPVQARIRKTITLYDKGDYGSMNAELEDFYADFVPNFFDRSVESNWLLFKNKLETLIKKYIPTISVTERSTSPWFNNSLKCLKNKKKRQYKAAKIKKTMLVLGTGIANLRNFSYRFRLKLNGLSSLHLCPPCYRITLNNSGKQ